jgi:CDP-diacylglycerol--glycerol-3-phosphate 3-phosphatidyltransferase
VTFATMLTLLRLILIIPIAILVLDQAGGVAALLLFIVAAVTDYFDGFVARRFDQVTSLGARLDASVDKVFVYVLFGALLLRGSYLGILVAAAFSRDLAVEILRQRAASKGCVIPANRWGKTKFLLQCLSIGIALITHSFPNALIWYVMANGLLAIAVVASIPGVIVVWNAGQGDATTPELQDEASAAQLRSGQIDALSAR